MEVTCYPRDEDSILPIRNALCISFQLLLVGFMTGYVDIVYLSSGLFLRSL